MINIHQLIDQIGVGYSVLLALAILLFTYNVLELICGTIRGKSPSSPAVVYEEGETYDGIDGQRIGVILRDQNGNEDALHENTLFKALIELGAKVYVIPAKIGVK